MTDVSPCNPGYSGREERRDRRKKMWMGIGIKSVAEIETLSLTFFDLNSIEGLVI